MPKVSIGDIWRYTDYTGYTTHFLIVSKNQECYTMLVLEEGKYDYSLSEDKLDMFTSYCVKVG